MFIHLCACVWKRLIRFPLKDEWRHTIDDALQEGTLSRGYNISSETARSFICSRDPFGGFRFVCTLRFSGEACANGT